MGFVDVFPLPMGAWTCLFDADGKSEPKIGFLMVLNPIVQK